MTQHLLQSEDLHQFLLNTSVYETEEQMQLRLATLEQVDHSQMMTSPEQAQFLSFMVELIGAKRAIEIGVMTGYGTLALAKALPEDGSVIACDIGPDWPNIGKPFWEKAGVAHKIDLRIQPALNTLQALIDDQQAEQFDCIFVDADKIHYLDYFQLSLTLLRPGGIMIFDNVLQIGSVNVYEQSNPATRGVYQMCQAVCHDARVTASMVPLGAGMLLVRKR